MKEKILSFLRPRPWTILFALILVFWQYIYAYRGVDFAVLDQMQHYFGSGLSVISWQNFFIRTFSLGLIWVLVALIIFLLLWIVETYVVSAHNRKISRGYANQPKEEFSHLLRNRSLSFKKHFVSHLWLSGFILLIPFGFIYLANLVEVLRFGMVLTYISSAQESGAEIDYNSISISVTSFLIMVPIWYLYACLDSFLLTISRRDDDAAEIEDAHYAVPVVGPTESGLEEDEDEPDSTPNPVI